MSNVNILNLPGTTGLTGAEYVPLVQSGVTSRAPVSQFVGFSSGTTTQTANTVYAGPSSGAVAAPTFRALVSLDIPNALTLGVAGTSLGSLLLSGNTSGVVTIKPQAAAGTFNFNLPITAGTSGYVLTSGGGGSSPMTWTNPTSLGIDLDIGSTAITGGTTTRILYDNAGVLGEYTLTGSGTVVAMATAPTFVTSITTPSVLATANDSGALGASGTAFADLFLASGGVINWAAGNVTLTQSSGLLTLVGGLAGSAQIWSGSVSSALQTLTGAADGFRTSAANVTQLAGENTTSSSASAGGFVGMYSNDGAAMASGDRLGGMRAGGSSSASALRNSALIGAFADQTWVDASAYGSRWEFQTTTNTTTAATTKLILGNAGVLSFGATAANTVPALKPSSAILQARLGDDSAYCAFEASAIGAGGASAAGAFVNHAAGTTAIAPAVYASGTNLTTAVAGAREFDGAQHYATIEASNRAALVAEQYFQLTADGSTISTIANFFGSTSNITLVSGAYYEIEIILWFLKTTSNTVVWTLTNASAPTSQNIYYEMSPVGALVAPPGTATMLVGQTEKDSTAAFTITTGSLTDATEHYARMRIWLQNGTGVSLKIQATATSGTITPRRGSFWRCRRLSTSNVGTFVA